MKSAYELAMERLQQSDPDSSTPLSEADKQALQEVESKFKAKIAEREVFLSKVLTEARQKRDREAVEQVQTQLRNERLRLQQEMENAKDKIRAGAR